MVYVPRNAGILTDSITRVTRQSTDGHRNNYTGVGNGELQDALSDLHAQICTTVKAKYSSLHRACEEQE